MMLLAFSVLSCGGTSTTTTPITTMTEYSISYYELEEVNYLVDFELEDNEYIDYFRLGGTHSVAKTSQERIFMWGNNNVGQLGDGTTLTKTSPVEITDNFNLGEGEEIRYFVLGDMHSAAITSLNRVLTWGFNFNGRLGDGTADNSSLPIDITSNFNLNTGESIALIYSGEAHMAAITNEFRVFAWGVNNIGQLGDGTIDSKNTPVEITSNFNLNENERIVMMSLGSVHSLAISSQNRVFAWGGNTYGQLGDGTEFLRTSPVDITGQFTFAVDEHISGVSAGEQYSLLTTSFGRVLAWGRNNVGQLGDGTVINRNTPIEITSMFNLDIGDKAMRVEAGYKHNLLYTYNYEVYSWGSNFSGELGNDSLNNSSTPVKISNKFMFSEGEIINQIYADDSISSLTTNFGNFYTWGKNDNNQLGHINNQGSLVPGKMNQTQFRPILLDEVELIPGNTIQSYTPERQNYTFTGWFLDEELTEEFDLTVMPDQDLELYGKFIFSPPS